MTTNSKRALLAPLAIAVALTAGACGGAATANQPPPHPPHPPWIGFLNGRLIIEGGASSDSQPRPLTGTVNFIQHGRVVASANTAADGTFSMALGAGEYQVQACTSKIQMVEPNGTHVNTCAADLQATVSAGHTTTVDIPDFIVP
jgi:hypothetical protein